MFQHFGLHGIVRRQSKFKCCSSFESKVRRSSQGLRKSPVGFVTQPMDYDDDTTVEINKIGVDDPSMESDNVFSSEGFQPNEEKIKELGNAEILTRVDLDLAYSSEKLQNLDILLMHVGTRASDYEALAVKSEGTSSDSLKKSLEFDLLSGILDSELRELDDFMSSVEMEIIDALERISSGQHAEKFFLDLEGKLQYSAGSLKGLQYQMSGMRMQSTKFQSTIAFHGQQSWNGDATFLENQQSPMDLRVKIQTTEEQRHILTMLEKSLARELEFENQLWVTKNNEEELLVQCSNMEREICSSEAEAEIFLEKLFEAGNKAEVFMGISKELMGKLHIVHFSLNSSTKREGELRSKVGLLEKQLQESDIRLEKAKTSEKAIQKQQNILYSGINDLKHAIEDLKEKLSEVESKAECAEAKCKSLANTNFDQDMCFLKGSTDNMESVNLLEKQLRESRTQLQHAKALVEANQEKQSMLYYALSDMGSLIEDLKGKVSKAEGRAESAESHCTLLAETNLEINEELGFLKGRVECLEAFLHQANDAKIATARDIGIQTKLISNLIMQLALERKRLQIQTSSLSKDNCILAEKYRKMKSNVSVIASQHQSNTKESEFGNDTMASQCESSKGAETESSATGLQQGNGM